MSKTTKKKPPTATPDGRFSFVHLAEPNNYGERSNYEVTLLFSEGTDLSVLKKMAAEQAAEAKKKYGNVKLHNPFRDAAEKDHLAGYEPGMTFITFRSNGRPLVVDSRKQPLDPADPDGVYSGCYGRVTCTCFHWQKRDPKTGKPVNQGVSFGLVAVQKKEDGEPFGFQSTDEGLDAYDDVENDGAEEPAAMTDDEIEAMFG